MASDSKDSGKRVSLHPLAIVAISDHFTGIQAGGSMKPPGSKVLGLLWGKQHGLDVTITDAVELLYTTGPGGRPIITAQEVDKQKELYTKVYKGHEMLGWYSVGALVEEGDTQIHREMMKFNESPFFLQMHPSPDPEAKDLPINLYESEMHYEKDEVKAIFVAMDFALETTQAERVTMEEVAKAVPTQGVSTLDLHASSLASSLRSLSARAGTLSRYLDQTHKGEVPIDHRLLRSVAAIAHQLPAVDRDELEGAFMEDFNDSLMVNYLATVTKSAAQMSELAEKFMLIAPGNRPHRF